MALDAILASKRVEVAGRRAALPLEAVRDGLTPSARDFEAAVRRRPALILEIKPASPSEGRLRGVDDLDGVIASYQRHADAISVVTDTPFFGGSLQLLQRVSAAVRRPVLCKDFVLDPYQVYEARRAGADAVLLMLSVLDDDGYRACAAAAASLRMGVLTEAHDEREVGRAVALGARVIGLNSRNLRTLAVDLDPLPALARRIPPGPVVVAESGIRSRADVRRLAGTADGFLIGTALMRAPDVDRTARELRYGFTKVCGLTRPEDANLAARLGATHGGVVFAAESPRRVEPAAAALVTAAPLAWAGVFVNEDPRRIAALVDQLGLAAVQLHGEEDATDVATLRSLIPPTTEIWQAVRVADQRPTIPAIGADRLLFDHASERRRGGTGRAFDWRLVEGFDPDRAILSGGIGPDNVDRACQTGFDFLDTNSAVELAPGRKSPELLARFFAARRTAPARPAPTP